jgi:adenylylsulfate kinase
MRHSLFIGRYQPLHAGHIKLIRSVIDEGKAVCVALRDTPISDTDPYTVEQRMEMFAKELPEVKVIVIPDIEEVCYGRAVGWGVREIRLDTETENISATKIRNGK